MDGARRRCRPPRPGRSSRRDARRARRAAPAPDARRLLGRPALAGRPGPRSSGRRARPGAWAAPPPPPASAAAAARRARRPPLPGLGVQRAAPACAEPELRGPREPGTSAAEAETRRGGPSATPWPRLETACARGGVGGGDGGGGGGGGPEPGPGASPAGALSVKRGRGTRWRTAVPTSRRAGKRCAPGPSALSASLAFQPRPRTPLSRRPHLIPDLSHSPDPHHPSPDTGGGCVGKRGSVNWLIPVSPPRSGFQESGTAQGREQDKREAWDLQMAEKVKLVPRRMHSLFLFFFFSFELCLLRVEKRKIGEGATEKGRRFPPLWPRRTSRTSTHHGRSLLVFAGPS